MAIYNVSGASELRSAVNSASGGDTIRVADGNYGDVSLSGARFSGEVTIQAAGSNANFSGLNITNAANLTVDGLNFEGGTDNQGYGEGTGLVLKRSEGITVSNLEMSDFYKAIQIWDVSGLKITDNKLENIAYDGIVMGHVSGVLVDGNDVTMHGDEAYDHKDAIQIYNQGPKAPASDVTISNNLLSAVDANIHGIYMGNNDAKSTGRSSEYYSNITITGNVIDTGHKLGIAIGETDGLTITDNALLQNAAIDGTRTINTPLILVEADSSDVRVTGNTVLGAPAAANSAWQGGSVSGGGWTIADNEIVSHATSVSNYATGSTSGTGGGEEDGATEGTTDGTVAEASADTFRFWGGASEESVERDVAGVDFTNGDKLVLGGYDAGTFEDVAGGNLVWNNSSGTYVKIDSVTDLHELVESSAAITATVQGDDLALRIDQDAGTVDLVLTGLGADYQDSFDFALF